ncbi:MAG: M23 family metallopeptidase [Anaerolineales bacterium]|nr:M23 family metallopeptidase [Anaerolineales bacterium]
MNWNGKLQQIWKIPGLILALAMFVITGAMLACSRADVPSIGGIGSGGLSPESVDTQIPDGVESEIPDVEIPLETSTEEVLLVDTTPDPAGEVVQLEPPVSPTFPPTQQINSSQAAEQILYTAQSGDTLNAVAIRFGVVPFDIQTAEGLTPSLQGLLDPGLMMIIPRRFEETGPSERLLPDSEVVFSPHAADFSAVDFAEEYGGFITKYREIVRGEWRTGAEVVDIAARDNSINPRLLLSILEYHAGWVTDPTRPASDETFDFPLGLKDEAHKGLYRQLTWFANEIGNGYYGWRSGSIVDVRLADGTYERFAPDLNAGTVALQYYFGRRHSMENWEKALSPLGWLAVYDRLFGDPWSYTHPLYEPGIRQPDLILPFLPGRIWAFTGGPHGAWEREAAWAALDFAPSTSITGCVVSEDWAVASAAGLVVRSKDGVVILDLDGDGREQTGWNLLYLHIADEGRVREGTFVEQGDRIGHPSCEGGIATGTHIHIARKYNGEWILADGPLPFNLSGWEARAGIEPYQGALLKDGREVFAGVYATQETLIWR